MKCVNIFTLFFCFGCKTWSIRAALAACFLTMISFIVFHWCTSRILTHDLRIESQNTTRLRLTLGVRYSDTLGQYVSLNHKQSKSPCESSTKNSLIEHFFNIIFTEFHTTPPVCVCVQMCAGQATYCYPNGCLQRDDLKRVDSPQAAPHPQSDRKQYMFVADEKNDFMKDFLEKHYQESITVPPTREPMRNMRPGIFKDKYNMLVKYKKMPSIELKYNLREQVKNTKTDLLKSETVDLLKTRWPMNKRNLVNGHKVNSKGDMRAPLVGKTNVFMAMLPANGFSEYQSKYFKRDITKTLNDNDANVKGFYLFENLDNTTETNASETISLETLIDNLLHNSYQNNPDDTKNETQSNNVTEDKAKKVKVVTERTTSNENDTINMISVNFDSEKVDKNKYTECSVSSTNKINEMIINLSERIEKQNNTSMKIAKRVVSDFDEEVTPLITNTEPLRDTNSFFTETVTEIGLTETVNQETTSTTSADSKETMVTKKNRQRRTRKIHISESDSQ